ncbi:MAG: pyruvate, water dikinase regulatory protein [Alphaproteobacteria bacterium]|nr:pyruvate, water dikinase regulatory protein [Alphaproteobacteria bacterium]
MSTDLPAAIGAETYHLHLVSDATGETLTAVARACLVQFESVAVMEHLWPLVRTKGQLEQVKAEIAAEPGIVLFTLVDDTLRVSLQDFCRKENVPCIAVLDPVIAALASHLGVESAGRPGRQHAMDAEYFTRIDAMNYVLAHDDGQATADLTEADIILVGVSRTSKTPTCVYLANRGIKAANVPIVPGCPLPAELFGASESLIVGLTENPSTLVQIRRNRLRMLKEDQETEYTDLDRIKEEVAAARRLFRQQGWPVIDVTRRSIEETAAAILHLYGQRRRDRRP